MSRQQLFDDQHLSSTRPNTPSPKPTAGNASQDYSHTLGDKHAYGDDNTYNNTSNNINLSHDEEREDQADEQRVDVSRAGWDAESHGTPEKPVKLTVHEALNYVGFGWFQIFLLNICGLCWASDAVEIQLLGIIVDILAEEYGLDNSLQSGLQGVVFAGMVCGSLLWGPFADRFGRKHAFGGCSLTIAVFGFITAFMPTWYGFLIMRFFTGVGVAGLCISFNLLLEFLPAKDRGQYLNFIELYFTAGSLFTTGIAWAIIPTSSLNMGWRWVTGIIAIVPLLCFLAYFILPESPSYLITSGKHEQAKREIERVARWNRTTDQLPDYYIIIANDGKQYDEEGRDITNAGQGTVAATTPFGDSGETADHHAQAAEDSSRKGGLVSEKLGDLRALFAPGLVLNTSLLWLIWFCDSIAYYGLIFATPNLLSLTNTTDVFTNTYEEVFITACGEIAGILYVALVINTLGRRKAIFTCFIVYIIFMSLIALPASKPGAKDYSLIGFILVARGFIFSGWSALFIYSPETYPTSLRSTGLSLCSAMARVAGAICPFVAENGFSASPFIPVGVFAGVACIGAVATLFLPYETNGKELSDSVHHGYKHSEKLQWWGKQSQGTKERGYTLDGMEHQHQYTGHHHQEREAARRQTSTGKDDYYKGNGNNGGGRSSYDQNTSKEQGVEMT